MKAEILELIRRKQAVSFVELAREIPGFSDPFGGGLDMAVSAWGNVILWTDLTAEAIQAMQELEAEGKIDAHLCGPFPYWIDGATLNLPLAKPKRSYKKPRWLPVTWSTATPRN
jgi:hypothetical protein